jgi:hypothetical protein
LWPAIIIKRRPFTKGGVMTVENLIAMLKTYPPNMRAFAYNPKGEMVEVGNPEVLVGDDEAWHEKQSEDVLLIS